MFRKPVKLLCACFILGIFLAGEPSVKAGFNALKKAPAGADDGLPLFEYEIIDPYAFTSYSTQAKSYMTSPKQTDQELKTTAGEYSAVGIRIKANKKISNVKIEVDKYYEKNSGASLEPEMDIRVAKKWHQAGRKSVNPEGNGGRYLVYELLLHDESLVISNKSDKNNYIKTQRGYINISDKKASLSKDHTIVDYEKIRNLSFEKDEEKMLWLTLRMPRKSIGKKYTGIISLIESDKAIFTLPLKVEVLPFELAESTLEYGLYYRARLTNKKIGALGSDFKTPEAYVAELKNMHSHGVLYPTIYEKRVNGNLEKALELRAATPLPKDKLYTLGRITGAPAQQSGLEKLKNDVLKWNALVKEYGYGDIYFYGLDEAKGKRLQSQWLAWAAVQKAGGKVFTACNGDCLKDTQNRLDVAVYAGAHDEKFVAEWSARGKQVLLYARPQVGIEDPELYRKNYGFRLWVSDYSGVLNYAYQHAFGDIWNDFDHHKYRDHVFAYPTSNGVIDTVQWEGFRAAVDDSRYADKLASLIGYANARKLIKSWLKSSTTMHQVRVKVINKILNPS